MGKTRYQDEYRRSLVDPAGYWAEQAESLHWDRRWTTVLDDRQGAGTRWFAGAQFNTCYNALDRHIDAGRGEQVALIYDSPLTGQQRRYSYRELRDAVALFAGGLQRLGV